MEGLKAKVPFWGQVEYFVKWTVISLITGAAGGVVGGIFGHGIRLAAGFFRGCGWLLYLLPVSGVIIVFLYQITKQEKNKGTNMVLEAISSDKKVVMTTGPLIFVSTVLTHLTGGSAGREGAALQIGGSLGTLLGRLWKLDERDSKIGVMCGMSACFGALFGTPLAAGVFSMEVADVGVMYYAAMMPCLLSAFTGAGVAGLMGLSGERFTVLEIPEFGAVPAVVAVCLGILCAVLSIGFCMTLHEAEHLYKRFFKNPYVRILAASAMIIGLTLLVGSRDYNGSSVGLIEEAMEGHVRYEAFILKTLFTALTLGAGYKGGEIVPTLCVGATFGCIVGTVLGFSPSLCAGCGMVALFAAVTNCPVSSLFIAFEMCGFQAMPYFAIVIAVSFTLSGYYGLYGSQKFMYSKMKLETLGTGQNEKHEKEGGTFDEKA